MKSFEEIYQEKDWNKAMEWLAANQALYGKAWTHYNMGVVAYKMNNLPLARYYWEASQLEKFDYPGLQKNLKFVRKELGLESVENISFLNRAKEAVFTHFSLDLTIAIFLVSCVGLLVYWWKKKAKLSWIKLGILTALILVVQVWPLASSIGNGNSNQAVALQEVTLYEGPSSVFEVLGKIPAGLKVKWDQKNAGWGKIEFPTEFTGWVKLDSAMIKELD